MVKEKELIERRVILPLAQARLAGRLGLVPPRAVVLFGPPGTGKTTFAKGVAARLGWPFVELFPSRLAGDSPAGGSVGDFRLRLLARSGSTGSHAGLGVGEP